MAKRKRSRREILYDKAWTVMSLYVRKRDKGICITCNVRNWDEELGEFTIKGMQAGHFHHSRLDFDEVNINCQCVRCNKWLHGNLGIYAQKIIEKHGLREFKALANRASNDSKGKKWSIEELEDLIKNLEIKTKVL